MKKTPKKNNLEKLKTKNLKTSKKKLTKKKILKNSKKKNLKKNKSKSTIKKKKIKNSSKKTKKVFYEEIDKKNLMLDFYDKLNMVFPNNEKNDLKKTNPNFFNHILDIK